MKLDALDHPKTLDLSARLNISLPTAIGHLELLWAWTGKKAAQGNIGKWPDGAIARACFYDGDPAVFIAALVDCRFLDAHPEHRLTVHDWPDHAPRWVKSKLSTEGLVFISVATSPVAVGDVSGDTSTDSKGRVVKGSEVKGRGTRSRAHPAPDDFVLTDDRKRYAEGKGLTGTAEQFDQFLDHHKAKGSQFVDWNAAWQTWVRNGVRFQAKDRGKQRAVRRNPD
jgi:hypothetical protein